MRKLGLLLPLALLLTACPSVEIPEPDEPPRIAITNLEDGQFIFGETFTVSGTASDDNKVSKVEVKLGTEVGALWQRATGTSSWGFLFDSTTFPDTSLYIQVKVTDSQGAANYAFVTVIVDNLGPAVSILTPNDAQAIAPNDYQAVSGIVPVVGTGSKVDRVELKVDEGSYVTVTGTTVWSYILDTTAMTEGTHSVTVRGVRDNPAAVGQEETRYFLVDKTIPAIQFVPPTETGAVSGTITLSGTASDDVGLSKVEISTDGGLTFSLATGTATWSFDLNTALIPDGAQTILARAVDITGLIGTTQKIYTIDNNPPTVTITSHSNGNIVSGIVNLTGTASDGVGVQKIEVSFPGISAGAFTLANGTTLWTKDVNTAALTNGEKTVTIRATDFANDTSETSVQLILDKNLPVFGAFTGIAENQKVKGEISISSTVTDADVGDTITSVQWRVGADAFTSTGIAGTTSFTHTFNTDLLTEGAYVLTYRAADNWGGYTDKVFNIAVDRTAPSNVLITSPEEGASIGASALFTGTAVDNIGMASLVIEIDTDDNGSYDFTASVLSSLTGGQWYYNWNTLSYGVGDKHIRIRAADAAGNETLSSVVTLNKSATIPSIDVTSPTSASYQKGIISIQGTSTGAGSAIVAVDIKVDSGAYVSAVDDSGLGDWSLWSYSLNTASLSEGSHSISARVTDNLAQTSTTLIQITVDNIVPVIAIASPTNGAVGSNYLYGDVTVTGTSSDTNLASVELSVDGGAFSAVTGTTSWTQLWDTTTLTNMAQDGVVLTARATDLAGNVTETTVTVDVRPKIFFFDRTAINPTDLATNPLTIYGSNFAPGVTVWLDNDGSGPLTGGVQATTINRVDSETITVTAVPGTATSGPLWVNIPGDTIASNSLNLDVWLVGAMPANSTLLAYSVSEGANVFSAYVESKRPFLTVFDGTSWSSVAIDAQGSGPENYGQSAVVRTANGSGRVYVIYVRTGNWAFNRGIRWNVSTDNGATMTPNAKDNNNMVYSTGGTNPAVSQISMTGYYDAGALQDKLFATWYDTSTLDLMFTRSLDSGATWSTPTALETSGDIGRWSSLGYTSTGALVVSYYDQANRDLKLAYSTDTGVTWTTRILDGDDGTSVGEYTSLKVASDDSLWISYFDGNNGRIKLATADSYSGTFTNEVIVDDGLAGWNTGLVLDATDTPYVSFYNFTFGLMRYGYKYNGDWIVSAIPDSAAITFPNTYSSIGISNGTPVTIYLAGGTGKFGTFKP